MKRTMNMKMHLIAPNGSLSVERSRLVHSTRDHIALGAGAVLVALAAFSGGAARAAPLQPNLITQASVELGVDCEDVPVDAVRIEVYRKALYRRYALDGGSCDWTTLVDGAKEVDEVSDTRVGTEREHLGALGPVTRRGGRHRQGVFPSLPAREVRSTRRVVRGRRRARAYRRSGAGADRFRSQRRRYASASETPSSHCGRCGARQCGASLRPQDGRGSNRLSPLPESRQQQEPLPGITRANATLRQYAHARIASILRNVPPELDAFAPDSAVVLSSLYERALIKRLSLSLQAVLVQSCRIG